ncbi:MAG: sigma-54 interaction domain-containing protein [bacterium]
MNKPKHATTEFYNILGQSPTMQRIFATISKIAKSPKATVLILGESGTGKELVARAVHEASPLANKPFVEINCTALPENLLETELFGYEPGAFTDAKRTKKGLLELADGGTFFLDEIGDLNLRLQVKLLKVLEEKTFRRIGGTQNIQVTMRIMAATNRDLADFVRKGKFREDLFYRLNVVTINLPSLRERKEDILLLANFFLTKFSKEHNRQVKGFSQEATTMLHNYPWPGNVRELKNSIERAILLGTSNLISQNELNLGSGHIVENYPVKITTNERIHVEIPPQGISLLALERAAIEKALSLSGGNQSEAARFLKISRETLRYRLKKHRIN